MENDCKYKTVSYLLKKPFMVPDNTRIGYQGFNQNKLIENVNLGIWSMLFFFIIHSS